MVLQHVLLLCLSRRRLTSTFATAEACVLKHQLCTLEIPLICIDIVKVDLIFIKIGTALFNTDQPAVCIVCAAKHFYASHHHEPSQWDETQQPWCIDSIAASTPVCTVEYKEAMHEPLS